MTDTIWDLDKFEGLARTEYILDASCITQAYLDSVSIKSGTGAATLISPQASPGGKIQLSVGATTGSAIIAPPLPLRWNDTTAVAAIADIEGIAYTGSRPNLWMAFRRTSGGGANYLSMYADDTGFKLRNAVSSAVDQVDSISGNILNVDDANAGLFADYQARTVTGHFSWSMVRLPINVEPGSGYLFDIQNRTLDAKGHFNHTLAFRKISITLIWNAKGGKTVVHLK